MSDEEFVIERDEKGRVLPGSRLGELAKGVPKIKNPKKWAEKERKKIEKEVNQRAQEMASTMLNDKLGDVIDAVYERAMQGDTKAMSLWLRHSTPVAPQAPKLVNSELLEDMQNEPPEQIIQSTVRAMAAGEVDVMLGKEIISACKASIESNFTDRFRKLMKKMQREDLSIEAVLPDLIRISQDMEPVTLEHDDEQ